MQSTTPRNALVAQIEARQEDLIRDLDKLNERIESVLATLARPAEGGASQTATAPFDARDLG